MDLNPAQANVGVSGSASSDIHTERVSETEECVKTFIIQHGATNEGHPKWEIYKDDDSFLSRHSPSGMPLDVKIA